MVRSTCWSRGWCVVVLTLVSSGCLRPNPGATTGGDAPDNPAETSADAPSTPPQDAFEANDGTLPKADVAASFCQAFRVAPRDWRWEWDDPAANVYTLRLLVDISGPPACWDFAGFNDCARVEMSWDEGVALARSGSVELRDCTGTCEVGDIFQTTEEWPERPPQSPTMQALVDQYGPPDDACIHLCTSDGLEFDECWPVAGP